MKGKIELYNISFLILKVELHFNPNALEAPTMLLTNTIMKSVQFKPSFLFWKELSHGLLIVTREVHYLGNIFMSLLLRKTKKSRAEVICFYLK